MRIFELRRQEFGGILVLEVMGVERRRRRCRSREKEVSCWGVA